MSQAEQTPAVDRTEDKYVFIWKRATFRGHQVWVIPREKATFGPAPGTSPLAPKHHVKDEAGEEFCELDDSQVGLVLSEGPMAYVFYDEGVVKQIQRISEAPGYRILEFPLATLIDGWEETPAVDERPTPIEAREG